MRTLPTLRTPAGQTRAGFTLIELVVSASLLVLLAAALTGSVTGMRGMASSGSVQVDLAEDAERAVATIVRDLKLSSFAFDAGDDHPFFFVDGAAAGTYAGFAHVPAPKEAQAGDPDFGPDREIVLLQPADADNNGQPDIDGNGDLVWDPIRVAYVRVLGADGTGQLQRRTSVGGLRRIASGVERIVFDDNASSGFELPLNVVRVRIFMRRRDNSGRLFRQMAQAVIRPRN